jgi:surfeit locus 1 family protein
MRVRIVSVLLLGLVGGAVLVGLGVWQLQRLAWKEAVLEDIENRIYAVPVEVPANPDPERDRYLPVHVSGQTGPRELKVLVSTHQQGAGFRIITALDTDDGRRLLLDRGFVPDEARTDVRPPTDVTITGNLHWPEERDRFTPDNDPEGNWWYARDVNVMAAELGTEPVMIVSRLETGGDPSIMRLPIDTSHIPNDHLGYAVTWFGLAIVWLGMTLLWLRRIARRNP